MDRHNICRNISGSGGGGTDGKSPYIGENGNWYVYNDLTQTWVDTGVRAEGVDGTNGINGLDGTMACVCYPLLCAKDYGGIKQDIQN